MKPKIEMLVEETDKNVDPLTPINVHHLCGVGGSHLRGFHRKLSTSRTAANQIEAIEHEEENLTLQPGSN